MFKTQTVLKAGWQVSSHFMVWSECLNTEGIQCQQDVRDEVRYTCSYIHPESFVLVVVLGLISII